MASGVPVEARSWKPKSETVAGLTGGAGRELAISEVPFDDLD